MGGITLFAWFILVSDRLRTSFDLPCYGLRVRPLSPSLAWPVVMEMPSSLGPQLEGKHQTESDAAAMFGYWPLPRQSPKCGPSRGTRCELYGIGATDLPEQGSR